MSKELLYKINGDTNGILKRYLDTLEEPINIAWYPSSGDDFRALFYLSKKYSEINPASIKENTFPNFFIYTDYFPWCKPKFFDSPVIFEDIGIVVTVDNFEELPELGLPVNPELVRFPKGSIVTGKVFFLEVKIKSKKLGEYKYPVIYAFVENEEFCSKILLPMKNNISHIIHIRDGGGSTGGGSGATWLLKVLKRLNCKIFIDDGTALHYGAPDDDSFLFKMYPNLNGEIPKMEAIRTIKSELWSGYGDVSWNIIK